MKKHFFFFGFFFFLFGCSSFDSDYFFNEAFHDHLKEYLSQEEYMYSDGVLEVYNISPSDPLYIRFFSSYPFLESSSLSVESSQKLFSASLENPFQYIVIEEEERKTEFQKVILYIPQKKTMIFIYAHTLLG